MISLDKGADLPFDKDTDSFSLTPLRRAYSLRGVSYSKRANILQDSERNSLLIHRLTKLSNVYGVTLAEMLSAVSADPEWYNSKETKRKLLINGIGVADMTFAYEKTMTSC